MSGRVIERRLAGRHFGDVSLLDAVEAKGLDGSRLVSLFFDRTVAQDIEFRRSSIGFKRNRTNHSVLVYRFNRGLGLFKFCEPGRPARSAARNGSTLWIIAHGGDADDPFGLHHFGLCVRKLVNAVVDGAYIFPAGHIAWV